MPPCSVCLSVCLSVCVSVTFVDCVKTNKHIFNFFSPPGNQAILFFSSKRHDNIRTRSPLTGASNAAGVGINHNSEPISDLLPAVNAATG